MNTWLLLLTLAGTALPVRLAAQPQTADSTRAPTDSSPRRPSGNAAPSVVAPRFPWFDRDRTFSLLDENDAFASSDSSYTQGLRFAWEFAVWPEWLTPVFNKLSLRTLFGNLVPNAVPRGCNPRIGAAERRRIPCGTVRVTLGQTMYTPPDITTESLTSTSRPYSGYLFTSFGAAQLYERAMVTSELTVGLLGPGAGAAATQSVAHWTWSHQSVKPMGWHHQLRNAPQFTLRNTYTASVLQYCWGGCNGTANEVRIFDVLPTAELVVGSLMNRASFGGTARVGWRFPDLVTAERIGTTRDPTASSEPGARGRLKKAAQAVERFVKNRTWVVGFAGHDQRYVLHNALLSGSYGDLGDGRWRDVSQIQTRHGVGETYVGVGGGLGRLSVAWQRITRTAEYTPNGGAHRFGSVAVTLSSPVR